MGECVRECVNTDVFANDNSPRRGSVYTILDTTTTLSRNEQFESFSNTFRQHQLIESVVINEFYLSGTQKEMYVDIYRAPINRTDRTHHTTLNS